MNIENVIMKLQKFSALVLIWLCLPVLLVCQNYSHVLAEAPKESTACVSGLCKAGKYSLFSADLDGSNVSLIKKSTYQDMTHPRVSPDKNWVIYTSYNDLNPAGCAEPTNGYLNTEIRAVQLTGAGDKRVVAPQIGHFNSNPYWIGATDEFTYLSGPVTALKFYRTTVDASINIVKGPTEIPVVKTIVPMDPQAHGGTNKIVFPGLYNPRGGYVKSIFMMNLSDSQNLVGLSIGGDRGGKPIMCANAGCENIMENDPKISPDGKKVAFMRQAPKSGKKGFGWHIFVVDVAKPLKEVDISYAALGSDVLKNDVLPEWVDNDTLVFSTIEIVSVKNFNKNVYTMKSNGSHRTKISLPDGFHYSDVFPFLDQYGKQRLIISAEKIGASCNKDDQRPENN